MDLDTIIKRNSMVIAPKNHFKQHPFVDRKNYIRTFKENVYNIGQKELSVLVYYGVAGIGKTSLRKEFPKYLEKHNCEYRYRKTIWASIDLRLEKYREKNTFLITLKNDLQKKYKIHFPAFEIAHAIYWKKAYPETPLRNENYLFFEGDNAFDDYFGVVDKIPYFSVVPATARLLKNLPDYFRKWWVKGEDELIQLSEKEALEIEETLPYFWAQDLNNYLEHASKSAVLFIDTYEALWENHRSDGHSRDEWIREELIPRLPRKVLWVICGKEALKWGETNYEWNEYLTQYKVKELMEDYCIQYLETRGITDKEIQEAIFKGSKGVPYYLELSADTYELIVKNNEKPKPEYFGDNHQKIADRFFRFLGDEEKNALNVLSVPRFWDYDLFEYLVKEFNTGYPINDYEELCSFSFIDKAENNRYRMHQLMQESLQKTQEQIKPESIKKIHKRISEYYTNKLKNVDIKAITQEQEIALTEAFYHAKNALEVEELINFFNKYSDPFFRAAFWRLILPMHEELIQIVEVKFGNDNIIVAATLNTLAGLYQDVGNFGKALLTYEKALQIAEKTNDPTTPVLHTCILNNLAQFYQSKGDWEKSFNLYQLALNINQKKCGEDNPNVATILNNLAGIQQARGNLKEAFTLYQQALDIRKKFFGLEHPEVANVLNNIATLLEEKGNYAEALNSYLLALDIREKTLGTEHPLVANTTSNLAGLYVKIGKYKEATVFLQRSLDIFEKRNGSEHPSFAKVLSNLGSLCHILGNYKEGILLCHRALLIQENILESTHPDIACTLVNLAGLCKCVGKYEEALHFNLRALKSTMSKNGEESLETALILNNLSELYSCMGEYEKGIHICKKALKIRQNILGKEHPYVATTLNNLGLLYYQTKEQEKALPLFQEALAIYENMKLAEHPEVIAILNNVANYYETEQEHDKSIQCYKQALHIARDKLGFNHPYFLATKYSLISLLNKLEKK